MERKVTLELIRVTWLNYVHHNLKKHEYFTL